MKSGWVLRPGAAEFPHENPLINRGVLWIGSALSGAETVASASAAAPATAPTGGDAGANRADDPPPSAPKDDDRARGAEDAPARPIEGDAGAHGVDDEACVENHERVETFVRAMAEVARAHGVAETAAHVESLFKFGTPAPVELSPTARAALLDGNILEATEAGVHATAWFARTSSAWQNMLRGEGGNLAACGESTLDGWTADLIACLLAKPSMASAIRRDLRRRGIAAFGMLDS